jgi:hypothetical protein
VQQQNPQPGDIDLDRGEIEGKPNPNELAQWLPSERKWWAESALRERGGMDPERLTGCFLAEGRDGAWRFRIFTDDEKRLVFGRTGAGTIPPTPP